MIDKLHKNLNKIENYITIDGRSYAEPYITHKTYGMIGAFALLALICLFYWVMGKVGRGGKGNG